MMHAGPESLSPLPGPTQPSLGGGIDKSNTRDYGGKCSPLSGGMQVKQCDPIDLPFLASARLNSRLNPSACIEFTESIDALIVYYTLHYMLYCSMV